MKSKRAFTNKIVTMGRFGLLRVLLARATISDSHSKNGAANTLPFPAIVRLYVTMAETVNTPETGTFLGCDAAGNPSRGRSHDSICP
jgi:hypothetical protein